MKQMLMSQLAIQIRGVSYKPNDLHEGLSDDSVAMLRANNIDNRMINFNDIVYVDRIKVSRNQMLKKGDILICASSGSKNLVGKAAQVDFDIDVTFGAFCKAVRPVSIDASYLGMYFQSQNYRSVISNLARGANINNIKNEDIDNLLVNVANNDERNNAVSFYKKILCVIHSRQQQLQKLDELVKARFVELFIGKGHPTKTIDEISLSKGEYGAQSASIEYDPTRPRYVRITDINDDGTLNDDAVVSINPDDDEKYRLEYGDFVFSRMGATVGKTFAFIAGNQIFAGYLIRYKLNQKLINPRYLFWYTKMDEYWNWVKLNQSGAAQPGINAKKYGSLRIPVPPIEQQEQFAAFVEQVDKSKVAVQKALDEAQLLFDSLMQKYFV